MARKISVEILGDSASLERAFKRSSRAGKEFRNDIDRAGRGALSAAVSFHGLGRAVAFSSAQFLGGAGIVFAIKSTIEAAEESQRVVAQTANAVRRSGQSWSQYGKRIQEAALEQSKLSGFDDERLLGTFSNLVRRTGDVNKALALNALAANVARGRNISLESATQLVIKASLGQAGALRRVGIAAGKHATALQLIDLLQKKYAHSAEAYGKTAAGAQDRFRVALQNTQEVLGASALPTLTKYLNKAADWLNNTENQQRLQRDLKQVLQTTTAIVNGLASAVKKAADAVGGFKHLVELLIGLKLATVIARWSSAFSGLGTAAGTAGAAGEVGVLQTALTRLVAGGPYIATLIVAYQTAKDPKGQIGGRLNFIKEHTKELQNLPVVGPLFQAYNQVQRNRDLAKAYQNVQKFGSSLNRVPPPTPAGSLPEARMHTMTPKGVTVSGPTKPPKTPPGPPGSNITVTQRNQWFDAMIGRKLDRVQDIGNLRGQIGALNQIAALISARMAKTKDVTRRLTLEDQLVDIKRRKKSIFEQIAEDAKQKADDAKEALKKAKDAAKQVADEAKRASLQVSKDAADIVQSAISNARSEFGELFQGPVLAPTDQQIKAKLGVPGVTGAKLLKDLKAQNGLNAKFIREIARLRKQGAPKELVAEMQARGVSGEPELHAIVGASRGTRQQIFNQFQIRERQAAQAAKMDMTVTINVNGTENPQQVAKMVLRELQKRSRKQAAQTRGRYGGANLGLH